MLVTALAALLLAAPVRVDAPQPGAPYVSPLRVRGTADVAFTLDLTNWDGLIVSHRTVARPGRFSLLLRFPKGLYARGALIVHPQGGRAIEIPLGTRVVSLQGLLGVRAGATPAQVRKAWGVKLPLSGPGGSTCRTAPVTVAGMTGYALFQDGRFGAAFFRKGAVADTGVRIGSTLAQLRRAYGSKLSSRPDKYVPGARNYFVGAKRAQLRFDVSKAGRVTTIAFGDESVRLVEGCA
jgi:hypothetical protein